MPFPSRQTMQRHTRGLVRPTHARLVRLSMAVLLAGGLISAAPASVEAPTPPAAARLLASIIPDRALAAQAAAANPAAVDQGMTIQKVTIRATPSGPALHTFDMYDPRAVRWQNPDSDACTATVTLSMLNTISYYRAPDGFVWKPSITLLEQRFILIYERSHMTAPTNLPGSDPHGWRNALNYYGWGSIDAGVYEDEAFSSFDEAAKGAVSALATTRKPAGILGANGTHAQFITGYKVAGDDPTSGSMDFTVLGVYLTDPWYGAKHRNYYVDLSKWQSGTYWIRFGPYLPTQSHARDPIDGQIGKDEWYGNWVIIAPVK